MTPTAITSMTAQEDGVKSPASRNGKLNGATEIFNEWSEPGSAAFDFRSMPPPLLNIRRRYFFLVNGRR
jgi:hypothetical protein